MSLQRTLRKTHMHTGAQGNAYTRGQEHAFGGLYSTQGSTVRWNFDILYYLASILDLQTLQAWRATCRAADDAAATYLNTRYLRLLRGHFADAAGFRSLLRITGSVISGSAALHVLDRDRAGGWEPTDIDVYVAKDQYDRVGDYLTDVESYLHVGTNESMSSHTYDSVGFLEVSHYENEHGKRIDVIRSSTHSALFPIPFFWSSHVMNYLTADSFCIAYPTFTLQGRGLLSPVSLVDAQYPHKRTLLVLSKYTSRGYDFRLYAYAWKADPRAVCAREDDEGCPMTIRYFGDPHCLTGTFCSIADAARSTQSRAQPDARMLVRWWRGGNACGGSCAHQSKYSLRLTPYVSTHRITRGFYETFKDARPIRDAIPGPQKY